MSVITVLIYGFVLFGTAFPHAAVMDSPEACIAARDAWLSSGFVANIKDAGGTVEARCDTQLVSK